MNYKFLIIGNCGVGKTSILNQFCHNLFINKYQATNNTTYFSNEILIKNKSIKINLWDTVGQTSANLDLTEILLKDSNAIILVYDITNSDSFKNLNSWLIKIKKMRNYNKNTRIIIVGNKNDLENREVHYSEVEKFSKYHNLLFIEINSKNKNTIYYLFKDILETTIVNDAENLDCYNRYC